MPSWLEREAMKNVIRVLKSQLPLPVVIEDGCGNAEVLEMAPAGKKKLGAYLKDARENWKKRFKRRK